MSFPQNQEENRITSTEETETERPLPGNAEQPQINVLNVVHRHQHIEQQVVQVDNRQNITKIILQPEQANVQSGDQEGPNKAFDKLKKTSGDLYNRKFDVDLSKFDSPASNFPEVHPEILSIDFYEGRFIPNDDEYDPKTRQLKYNPSDKKVIIDKLTSQIKSQSFISIVGYPGAGKTTLSKRLARRLDQTRDFLVLRILFMNIGDWEDEKVTLKEFLLGDVKYDLENKEKDILFSWIKNHTQNCFFIFDGFDQVNWTLIDKVKRSNYDTLLTCQELVSNLCQGLFLPNCHIVFTSRPHAMLTIPQRCRPKQTYFIGDFTTENMKILFNALINDEQKTFEILDNLAVKTPHLESICHNPLMLQLYLRATLGTSDKIENISTMTGIFHRVLENLKSSDHAVSLSDDIVISLSKLAFKATENKTVLITTEDLYTENLTSEQVQALVVTLFGSNRACGLLEGNRRLYFSHQTFQEFFSALYMFNQMSLENFTSFVQNNLVIDHWSVVVQLLSGLLLDPYMNEGPLRLTTNRLLSEESNSSSLPPPSQQSRLSSTNEKVQKQKVFISELYEKIWEIGAKRNDDSFIAISKILREGNNKVVTVTAGSYFDGGWIRMSYLKTQNDFHVVASFLKWIPVRIKQLDLSECKLTSDQFRPWIEAIKSMPGIIVGMDLQVNCLSTVDDVIEIMHKVEEKLVTWKCLDDGNGKWRSQNEEEKAKLQDALNELDNKHLKIWYGYDSCLKHKDL